mmetsp:Transcript_182201/g.443392  ORF Transcript_182201/g.443392 Transcript_182201/m.443392 type:complete len:228 (-) Transcript_182201:409-1092(-)
MCKDVDVVGRRYRHGNLELPGQVRLAIQRLLLNGCAPKHLALLGHLFAVHQENLMVGTCTRQAMVMDGIGVAHNLIHEFTAAHGGVAGAEYVAAHVPAGCDGVHACTVDTTHGVLHVSLQHTMKLPSLASCDLQSPVRVASGDIVHGEPLLSGAITTGQAYTDHEAEGVLNAELLPLFAQVPIVLLVAAVKLDHLGVLERHLAGADVVELLLQGTPQLLCLCLDDLI